MRKSLLIWIIVCACINVRAQTIITTIGGNGIGIYGDNVHDGGPATAAEIRYSEGLCLDKFGNIYIAESGNNRVRKITKSTGIITTIGGTGAHGFSGDGGPATDAQFLAPEAVFADTAGNIYVADAGNSRIRKIVLSTGIVTNVVGSGPTGLTGGGDGGDGGPATNAEINGPSGVCLDNFGNIYIADYSNNKIKKVNVVTGIITTVAGIGPMGYTGGFVGYSGDGGLAINAQFSGAIQVFADSAGNLFICDQWNHAIRKVNASTGIITTIAGTGTAGYTGDGGLAISAQLNQPSGLYVDKQENVFIAEYGDGLIRKIDGATGIISTVAGIGTLGFSGDGGPATNAELRCGDVFLDQYGTVFIADEDNNRIRMVYNSKLAIPQISPIGKEISIYPNPTTGSITIEYAKGSEVIMYDAVGKVVNRLFITSDKEAMNIETLPNGVYMIQLVDETTGIRTMKKIVKE
jgi:hypothetical protein